MSRGEKIGEFVSSASNIASDEIRHAHDALDRSVEIALRASGRGRTMVRHILVDKSNRLVTEYFAKPAIKTVLEASQIAEEIFKDWHEIKDESPESENLGEFSRTQEPREPKA